MDELEALRRGVAEKTRQILGLLAERNDLARRIGEVKAAMGLPVEDVGVEEALAAEVVHECRRRGVPEQVGLKLLAILTSEAKRVQGLPAIDEGRAWRATRPVEAGEGGRWGGGLIRLDVGEPDFPPPAPVIEACCEALRAHRTHYTSPRGIPPLLSALQRHLRETYGFDAREGELMVTMGGRFAVYSALAATLREGESALVVDPSWHGYRELLRHLGARVVAVRTRLEDGWEPQLEAVERAVKPHTRAMILSYPSNPTGKVVSRQTFRGLVDIANEHGLTVISDEAYAGYAYGECPSILDCGAVRFILISTFSKAWAMTGFRIGYVVSSRELIDRMAAIAGLLLTSVPEFIQYGAIKALECREEARRNAAAMRGRVEAACRELDSLGVVDYYRPDGGLYIFPEVRMEGFDSSSFAERLLVERGVAVSPGVMFGDYTRAFRISLCQPTDRIVEGIRRMAGLIAG